MREILFRAWTDKKTKIESYCWLSKENNHFWGDDLVDFNSEKIVSVEQFTGLYDATKWDDLAIDEKTKFLSSKKQDGTYNKKADWKGKKIFEGDILKYDCCEIDDYIPCDFVGVVDSCCCVENDRDRFFLYNGNICKIIGNFHENHELLEG